MAVAGGAAAEGQCTPEEEAENREQQVNEMDMIQSIFEGQFVLLGQNMEYMVKITPRVDGGILIATKDEPSPGKEVTHISEVTLYVKYPTCYPSHSPPDLHLSARWMDNKIAPLLVGHLREVFVPGCPVVYEWVMYLQDNMLQEYSHHCSTLYPQHSKVTDSSSTSGPHPLCQMYIRSTSLVHDMEEYDKFEVFQEFQAGQHECGVCFNQVIGTAMCQPCGGCGITYCKQCLSDYCQSCIGNSRMVVLECPNTKCHEVLPDIHLKKILPEEFFKRYIMIREKVELDSIPGMVFCPRCKARTLSDPKSDVVVCENTNCGFPFCRTCQQTWHGPGPCPALDKVASLSAVEDTDEQKDLKISEQDKQRRLEELQSMLWVLSSASVMSCPKCRSQIQKNGGCNKMTCSTCNSSFCWCCGKPILGYSHFDDADNDCVLFRDEDYLPPAEEEDITGMDSLEEIETMMNKRCPRCSKVILKSSDSNWMTCYRCSFQYCHLCREPCFGLYHFNEEYGCKRFTSMKDEMRLKRSEV